MVDQAEVSCLKDLRCEKCGYSLSGLNPHGNCSECGLEVSMSMARIRAGTPWQQKPGLRSLVSTWQQLLFSDECWSEVRIRRSSRRSMLGWTRVCSYGFFALGLLTQILIDTNGQGTVDGFYAVFFILSMLAMEMVALGYRSISGFRLGLIAPLREECDDLAAQEEVLGNASLGMLVVLPVFSAFGIAILSAEGLFNRSQASDYFIYIGIGIILTGLPAGALLSELIHRRGWRAMRYRKLTPEEIRQVSPKQFVKIVSAE
jgi:hypothetical protein